MKQISDKGIVNRTPVKMEDGTLPRQTTSVGTWTFLTNHAHTLICLARRPDALLREVASEVGITERAVHNIVADLEESGVVTRERDGRRNHYVVHANQPLRHPIEAHCTVGHLIAMVGRGSRRGRSSTAEEHEGPRRRAAGRPSSR